MLKPKKLNHVSKEKANERNYKYGLSERRIYKLNKNTPDLVYNFADEVITYRKEEDKNGNLQIVEYRKKDGRKGKKATTRRVAPSHEMSIEDFDAWKKQLTEDAHEYFNKDKRETRENVSIENLLETDLVCDGSVEEEYIRAEEEERQSLPKTMDVAMDFWRFSLLHKEVDTSSTKCTA